MQVFQVGDNAKRLRFQIRGIDHVNLSEYARFCVEHSNIPVFI